MSDRYAGRICIGGTLPAKKLDGLIRAIVDTDPDIEMYSGRPTADRLRDWLAEREKPESLFLHAGELTDGSFHPLEQWLCANGMSYLRHSDSYCDVEAEIVGYVNGTRVRSDANNAGDAMVRACDVCRVREALSQGRVRDAMTLLNGLLPSAFEADVPSFMIKYAKLPFTDRKRLR